MVYGKGRLAHRDLSDDDEHEDIEEEVCRSAIESMTHYLVVGGRQRRGERVYQENMKSLARPSEDIAGAHECYEEVEDDHIEDEHMNEMMANFFEVHVSPGQEGNNNEGDEILLQDVAKTPLYDGSQYSVLHTCLELLNL